LPAAKPLPVIVPTAGTFVEGWLAMRNTACRTVDLQRMIATADYGGRFSVLILVPHTR
jgi:hypothetical protein